MTCSLSAAKRRSFPLGAGSIALSLLASAELAAQRGLFSNASVRSGIWFPDRPRAEQFCDIDGDGAIDVVMSGSLPRGVGPTDAKFTVYLNDGSGRARSVRYGQWSPPAGAGGGSFGLGDLNCDGKVDALVAAVIFDPALSTRAPMFLPFEGNGYGNFAFSSRIHFHPPLASEGGPPYIHDLTGDGYADILIGVMSGPTLLYVNDGGGIFRAQIGAFPSSSASGKNRIADLDLDGDLDVVSDVGYVLWNDGNGMFRESVIPGGGAQALDTGDVTGDGYPDILFAPYAPMMQLYVNDGRGGFVDESQRFRVSWPTNSVYRRDVQIIDLDGDGDLDIFAPGRPVEAYLNDGTGMFTDGRAALGLDQQNGTFMVDMDRDGDPDLWRDHPYFRDSYWSPGLHSSILANDPLLGGTLDIELHATPGRSVSYLLGFARLDAFIPGIGWSALDPSLTIPWPSAQPVPASGIVRTSLSVPNLPALRGLQLHLQGVDVDLSTGSIHAMNVWPVTIQ
jgi:hypothetical protein